MLPFMTTQEDWTGADALANYNYEKDSQHLNTQLGEEDDNEEHVKALSTCAQRATRRVRALRPPTRLSKRLKISALVPQSWINLHTKASHVGRAIIIEDCLGHLATK